ncbi:hypothetical protein LMH73_007515 [Vibrio splendidus]|nr:hypothetical protein [Vibrio splendidus]MCC4880377.1 hypothetical protein [Vibrio splendidus]
MIGLVCILIVLALLGIGHGFYESYVKIDKLIDISIKKGAATKKWHKKKARILSVTYNAHLMQESDQSVIDEIELNSGILVKYEYMVDGKKTSSMSLINFPAASVLSRVKSLKAGSIVPVLINPKSNNESYLFIANSDDYLAFKQGFFIESLPKLAFAQLLFLIIIYLIVT